jgi:lysophospholipase L1-like esterase
MDIAWTDVEFDFADQEQTNLPYDSHPSAQGHVTIAERIAPFLNQLLDGK